MEENKNVKKNIPSPVEKLLEKFAYVTIGNLIPDFVTPNMMTAFGALSGLFGIICASLSRIHPLFLIGTCIGILGHLFCDNLDGFIARKKNLKSNRGAYFDLLTDILHITFLLIAMTFAGVMHWWISIFLVPVYALIIFTSMNEIHYLGEFSFPTVGPAETHILFVAIMIGSMITKMQPIFTIREIPVTFADLVCLIGGIPMYFEMIRLQISIYFRIRKAEKKDTNVEESVKEEE